MKNKHRALFSDYTFENWRNLIIAAAVCFHIINIIAAFRRGAVGVDFIAYWGVGRISDEYGFSQIYELDKIRDVYSYEIKEQGFLIDLDKVTPSVPYLPIFVFPFKILSRVDLTYSFWIWNFINLVVLFGYLGFFLCRLESGIEILKNKLYFLILVFISYPFIANLTSGNINVFLLICTGEFLRNGVNNKPFLAGLWLGGLLLKPPLLILIVPILIIKRNWEILKGFFVSSIMILLASIFLAGLTGMQSLINLWIKYPGDEFSNTSPELMINWRMIGFILNDQFNLSIGWIITVLGIVLTLWAVFMLIKQKSHFRSTSWVLSILGVFSATIAVTWHAHFYVAMVLLPFLIYASVHKLLPEKIFFFWAIVTPVVMFCIDIIGMLDHFITKIGVIDFKWMVVVISGFIMNLTILYSTIKYGKFFPRDTNLIRVVSEKGFRERK